MGGKLKEHIYLTEVFFKIYISNTDTKLSWKLPLQHEAQSDNGGNFKQLTGLKCRPLLNEH